MVCRIFVYPLAAGAALVGIAMYVREAKTGSDSVSVGEYLKRAIGIVYDKRKSLFPLFFVGDWGCFIIWHFILLIFLIEETYHIDGFSKEPLFISSWRDDARFLLDRSANQNRCSAHEKIDDSRNDSFIRNVWSINGDLYASCADVLFDSRLWRLRICSSLY